MILIYIRISHPVWLNFLLSLQYFLSALLYPKEMTASGPGAVNNISAFSERRWFLQSSFCCSRSQQPDPYSVCS